MNDDNENADSQGPKRTPRRKVKISATGPSKAIKKSNKRRDKEEANSEDRSQIVLDEASGTILEEPQIFDPNIAKKRLRLYFLITLFFGSAIILFPFTTGVMNMAIATGFMAFYLLLGNKFAKYPNTRAVFGDSMYYLGFLFTFVALIAAMMNISEESEVDTIIAQMGPALITTVIGMAVRIYLTQFDAITTEPETEAMNSLGLLSANLIDVLDALNKTTEQNRQAILEMQTQSADQLKSLAEVDLGGVTNRFNNLATAVENLAVEFIDLKNRAERSQITINDIELNLSNLQSSAERVTTQLDEVEVFNADLETLKSRVSETTESFKAFSDRLENRVGNSAAEINNSVVGLARDLSRTEEEIRNLAETLRVSVSEVVDFLNRR